MTYGDLCKMVDFLGLQSFHQVYVVNVKDQKRYNIKDMQRYGTDSGSIQFGIIELEEDEDGHTD